MRALFRTRLLAALCAICLVVATAAQASKVGKPIDRPDDPESPTTETGEPDTGHGNISIYLRAILLTATRTNPNLYAFLPVSWFGPSRAATPRGVVRWR